MSQSDYNIGANPSGLNMRTEINQIFDSILTNNSGSTAPTVTKAFMMWVDTSNATYYYLKMRNHDNTAWATLGIYTVATKAYTSYAEGTVKLTENQIIDGVKTFSSSPIVPTPTTGTQAVNKDYVDGKMVSGTAINSTSGTSIDFTGIPSWVKKITVMFNGVSTNGTSSILIQIGNSSITTSGYIGSSTGGGGSVATLGNSIGFLITYTNVAATAYSGIINLINISSNTWIESGVLGGSSTGVMNTSGGSKTLSETLDRIRVTTVNGTDTFDAGQINIIYEG